MRSSKKKFNNEIEKYERYIFYITYIIYYVEMK